MEAFPLHHGGCKLRTLCPPLRTTETLTYPRDKKSRLTIRPIQDEGDLLRLDNFPQSSRSRLKTRQLCPKPLIEPYFSHSFRRNKSSGRDSTRLMGSFISHGLTAGRRPQFHLCACAETHSRKKERKREREVAAGGLLKNNRLGSLLAVASPWHVRNFNDFRST